MRELVGFLLRLPVVAILAVLWILSIWPVIVVLNLIGIVLIPIAYFPLFLVNWLHYSFLGRNEAVLPDYWEDYPDVYVNNMQTGFPTLKKWLLKGPNESSEATDSFLFGCAGCVVWFVLAAFGLACCLGLLGIK